MSDTRKLLDLTVDEFRELFFPDRSGSFSGGGAVVTDTPTPPPAPVRIYKWACQLIGMPPEVRQLYGTDNEITAAWEKEKWEGYPDERRTRFYLKG